MSTCQALIQQGARKGQPCGNSVTDTTYCSKHLRQAIIEKAEQENKRLCDVYRGCYTVLEDHQSKCIRCLHQARIRDRKRDDEKRQDPTLCLDCGMKLTDETRAKGKHDKLLRRCVPCYEKLQKYESQREPRTRIYRAEVFTNKHVLWNHYVKGAQKRQIDFGLTKARFNELITGPCFYCDYTKDGEVNGLDRIDNNKGYTEENCVTCCGPCNMLKGSQHPQEFLDKLVAIHGFATRKEPISADLVTTWRTTYVTTTTPTYTSYKKSGNTRNIEFALSEHEFMALVKQSCYLCGIQSDTNHNGIDRFDNSKGYVISNCRPCCGHCNLLKKDIDYNTILERAAKIANKHMALTDIIRSKNIPIRSSKVEARIKVESPLKQESVSFEYKPINEVIQPKEDTPVEIQQLLKMPEKPIKQWKSKQIFQTIQEGKENTYKVFCEANNKVGSTWTEEWASFVLSVKGKTFEQTEDIIRAFVEELRRLRHNELCAKKDLIERSDRQQWPSHMVVRAFLEGKLDTFKTFTETYTDESPEDPKWMNHWNIFIESLENARNNEITLKELCSKFMTAQRTKKYRKSKSAP